MTSDVLALYQSVILDHNRQPRNVRALEGGRRADGNNPLCGDRVTVYVHVADDVITEVAFQGTGCAIFRASASLMTESVTGRTVAEADALCQRVHDLVTALPAAPIDDLGPVSALAGVRQFPVRVRCALLPWRTLRAAAQDRDEVVSTE
jgi:nitrogen fixation NifU-like protein